MNLNLINSEEYKNLNWHDWDSRHNEDMQKKYGVWRWAGIFENRELILKEIGENRIILDIGGALAPIGFGSFVIDTLPSTIQGEPVISGRVSDVENENVDMIFSSHCLEHIKYIKETLHMWSEKLVSGGSLVLHVPSINGSRYWHPDVKPEHFWLFCLKDYAPRDIKKIVPIDYLLEQIDFRIEVAKYVGDNSILVISRKK